MLKLPRGHSRYELQLARQVAEQLGSEDLHVFWSEGPPRVRVRPPPVPSLAKTLSAFGTVIGVLTSALGSRRPRRP